MIDPNDQFQIGDPVLYVAQGIKTTVVAYVWAESTGGEPMLVNYKLACGISVPKRAIIKWLPKETPPNPA